MGRFKSVEIKGLLIKNFGENFIDAFKNAIETSNLSENQILEKLVPKFDELLSNYEDSVSTFYLDKHKFDLNTFLKSHFDDQRKIAKTNEKSFIPFILYTSACVDIYEEIIHKISRKKIDSTLKINVALYGLIIRRAQEVVDLLLCGYIDGAMIIWRSLYENAIILLFLALQNDNELADKYYQHSIKSSRKGFLSYSNNHKELKFPPLPSSTEKILKSEAEKIEAKYGKDFLENEFGWADSLFPGKQKANLRLLEDKVKMNKFRPYYLLCCEHIHPSFKNYMEGNKIILPRLLQKNLDLKSFIDPMQFTIGILHEINDYILYEFSIEDEFYVNVLLLEKIFKKQQDSFEPKKKEEGK